MVGNEKVENSRKVASPATADEALSGAPSAVSRGVQTMLVWRAGAQRYASPIDEVHAVTRATAVVPSRRAGPVLGHLDFHGTTIPVVDPLRALGRSGNGQRAIRTTDRFVLLEQGRRKIAVVVDEVEGLREIVPEADLETVPETLLGRVVNDAFPLLTVFEVSELRPLKHKGRAKATPS